LIIALAFLAGLASQTPPAQPDGFAGYAGPDLVIRETAMICNGERYVVSQTGREITQVRSPWGILSEGDLTAIGEQASGQIVYAEEIGLLCAPGEFQLSLRGRSVGEDPPHSTSEVRFRFLEGRLVSDAEAARDGAP